MKCDTCREKTAIRDVIVEDNLHNLIIMSFCSRECAESSPFEPISNFISLDKAFDDGVE